jgi:hypothetical protein
MPMTIRRVLVRLLGMTASGPRSTTRFPTFDATGWHGRQRSESNVVWTNDEGDSLTFNISEATLGGHLKTGQSWTGQNRPVGERPKHECSTPVPWESASPRWPAGS